MTLRLNGSTSGYVEIDAPATAGSTSITLPAVSGGQFVVTDSNGNLGLGTTSPVEELHINSATPSIRLSDTAGSNLITRITNSQGDLYFDADFGGTTGDIIFRSNGTLGRWVAGGGLAFGADTAAVNQLDDYEEGAWTPSYTGYGGSYTNRSGHYTKIGNTVCAWCYIQTSTAGSSGQGVEVTGLPYPLNISSYAAASQLWGDSWTTGRSDVAMLGINNSAAVQMIHGSCGGGSRPAVVLSDIGVGNLLFQITYRT